MSKGVVVVAVIALIIGAGGLGIGIINTIQEPSLGIGDLLYLLEKFIPKSGVVKTWYEINNNQAFLNEFSIIGDQGILVNFVVHSGESQYFSFSCYAHLEVDSPTIGSIEVAFVIDGNLYAIPHTAVGINSTGKLYATLYLQKLLNLPPGSYNVTVLYSSNNLNTSSSYVQDRCLLVQTLIP